MSKITYIDYISGLLPESEVADFQACYTAKLPKTIKVIESKISIPDFIKLVESMGWELEQTINSDSFYVRKFTDSATLGQHFLHQWWFFYIQELSASMSAPRLDAKKWEIILDMCSAPGGKAIQLADTGAFVVANEPLNPRRKALIYNLNRTWSYNTAVTNMDWVRFGKEYPEFFDKILIDAPCSGEWMSYKTWWPISRNSKKAKSFAKIQFKLLESAIASCKTWWLLVYSTCTLNEIENEEVVSKISKKYQWFLELEFSKKYRPHRDKCGGFFLALFRKIASVEDFISKKNSNQLSFLSGGSSLVGSSSSKAFQASNASSYLSGKRSSSSTSFQKKSPKNPNFNISSKLQLEVKTYLQDNFGIQNLPENMYFLATDNAIYLTDKIYLSIHGKMSLDKIWIPILNISRDNRRIPLHHLWNILWNFSTKNNFTLSLEQLKQYADKKDIEICEDISTTQDNFLILKMQKYGFSLSKKIDNLLKNKLA